MSNVVNPIKSSFPSTWYRSYLWLSLKLKADLDSFYISFRSLLYFCCFVAIVASEVYSFHFEGNFPKFELHKMTLNFTSKSKWGGPFWNWSCIETHWRCFHKLTKYGVVIWQVSEACNGDRRNIPAVMPIDCYYLRSSLLVQLHLVTKIFAKLRLAIMIAYTSDSL